MKVRQTLVGANQIDFSVLKEERKQHTSYNNLPNKRLSFSQDDLDVTTTCFGFEFCSQVILLRHGLMMLFKVLTSNFFMTWFDDVFLELWK